MADYIPGDKNDSAHQLALGEMERERDAAQQREEEQHAAEATQAAHGATFISHIGIYDASGKEVSFKGGSLENWNKEKLMNTSPAIDPASIRGLSESEAVSKLISLKDGIKPSDAEVTRVLGEVDRHFMVAERDLFEEQKAAGIKGMCYSLNPQERVGLAVALHGLGFSKDKDKGNLFVANAVKHTAAGKFKEAADDFKGLENFATADGKPLLGLRSFARDVQNTMNMENAPATDYIARLENGSNLFDRPIGISPASIDHGPVTAPVASPAFASAPALTAVNGNLPNKPSPLANTALLNKWTDNRIATGDSMISLANAEPAKLDTDIGHDKQPAPIAAKPEKSKVGTPMAMSATPGFSLKPSSSLLSGPGF